MFVVSVIMLTDHFAPQLPVGHSFRYECDTQAQVDKVLKRIYPLRGEVITIEEVEGLVPDYSESAS